MAELDGVEWMETENFSVQFKDIKPKSYSVKIVDKIIFQIHYPASGFSRLEAILH